MTDVPLIVMADRRVPMWAPLPWYKRPLGWLGLVKLKPMVILTKDAVLMCHPKQVEVVANIMRDDGYSVITGRARTPPPPGDRARWAKLPHALPKVTRPNLRPVPKEEGQ